MQTDSVHHFNLKIDGVEYSVGHHIITGQKLLELAGKPANEFEVALRVPGDSEQLIELTEEFDLNAPGREHFVTIDKRRHYNLKIDETIFRVAGNSISGKEILALVHKDPADHFVVQRFSHADDVVIELDQTVDLAAPGIEKFDVVRKTPEVLRITIDDVQYTPPKAAMTGQELRALPNPPIAATRDLWLDVPGKDDLKIAVGQLVNLANGMVFYTAPSTINPGQGKYAAA